MLKDYEEEILFQMFNNGIIGGKYCSVQKVASIIKWRDVAKKYGVRKSFSNILWKLKTKGYVDFHGKARDVVSLTKIGVDYVIGKLPR